MNSMEKKSRKIKWPEAPFTLAWLTLIGRLAMGGSVLFIAVLLVSASLDPDRALREQREFAKRKTMHVRQGEQLMQQAAAEPPTGELTLNFQKLRFRLPPDIQFPPPRHSGYALYVPAGIKIYDGREIRLQGFMIPTRMENGLVLECMVLPNQMSCCYGREPRFCEYIVARFDRPGVPVLMDRPTLFEGRFHVGDIFDGGYWTALYSLDGTAVEQ